MKKVLERTIENSVVAFAKKHGVFAVKLNVLGRQALPDRMFLGPRGGLLFIEFKRPGGKPTPLQAHLHREWAKLKHTVHVVEDVEVGKKLVWQLVRPDMEYPT